MGRAPLHRIAGGRHAFQRGSRASVLQLAEGLGGGDPHLEVVVVESADQRVHGVGVLDRGQGLRRCAAQLAVGV